LTNIKLRDDIETIFLVPSLRYMYLSSSMIRQLSELGADLKDFVPSIVAKALSERSGNAIMAKSTSDSSRFPSENYLLI
jgi:phosphopantetheine adenylyltransferase